MKYRFLIVGIFLIAMLAIGAASASDFTQNDEIAACSDNLSSVDDSANVLGDSSYYDDDFYVYVQENYSYGKYDWDIASLIYINSYCQKNGTFTVSVDGVDKLDVPLTDGHFSVEEDENGTYNIYYKSICPNDLALDYGEYDIKVKFGENTLIDNKVTLNEKEDFDIYLSNPYYCEEEYWSMPSFIIIDSNNMKNGTLEVFVNGNRKLSFPVVNGCFEWIADCSNRSRYLSSSDLLDGYGTYGIRVTFTENGSTRILKDESVLVAEFEPTVDPKLELGFYSYVQYLRNDNVAYIYLPREATGSLTLSYNNEKNKTVPYSKGFATYTIYAWTVNHLGETTFTATYVGDDFGTLTATGTIVVAPTVNGPAYASQGEEFSFSMITHEWVNGGKFNVYDYAGDVKGNLITSGVINGGLSSVKLSSNKPGLNKYYLEFDTGGSGKYHSIQEVPVIRNSENITVDIPTGVQEGQDFNVTVNAPASPYTFAYISVDGGAAQYYSMENGTVSETLQGLSAGTHTVSVQYNNGYYEEGSWVGDVYSNTFTVTVKPNTTLTAVDVVTTYNGNKKLVAVLKADGNAISNAKVTFKLGNMVKTVTTDKNGQASLSLDGIVPNAYVATIAFAGDDDYAASNTTAKVTISKGQSKVYLRNALYFVLQTKMVQVTLWDANNRPIVGKTVYITLDEWGWRYSGVTDKDGNAYIRVGVGFGKHPATVSFEDDDCYNSDSKTGSVRVIKETPSLMLPGAYTKFKASDATKTVKVYLKDRYNKPLLLGTKVFIKVNGKYYVGLIDINGIATININLNRAGVYDVELYYTGNTAYNEVKRTTKISII